MWRGLRIAALLAALVFVAAGAWVERHRTASWDGTLWIGIFPVAGDSSAATTDYLDGLSSERFASIERFFEREARRHDLPLARPVKVVLQPRVAEPPPRLAADAGMLGSIAWSLRTRWYARGQAAGSLADIRVFVVYHDPERMPAVPHSLGLQKGLVGVVHAFAEPDMDGENAIVIAHEVMHALGASDKYEPASGQPRFPEGYAVPQAEPRHPQPAAEIMAGRTALSPTEAEMPESLDEVVVGAATAVEIHWLAAP